MVRSILCSNRNYRNFGLNGKRSLSKSTVIGGTGATKEAEFTSINIPFSAGAWPCAHRSLSHELLGNFCYSNLEQVLIFGET